MKKLLSVIFICFITSLVFAQNSDGSVVKPIGPYVKSKMAMGIVFVSGQIAIDPKTNEMVKGDFRLEVNQVMKNLNSVLNENGMNFNQVAKCTVYLTDLNNYTIFNEVYASYFNGNFPAREVVQVVKLPKNARIEISAIAAP